RRNSRNSWETDAMLDRPSPWEGMTGAASTAPVIAISQLAKSFGQNRILDGLDLEISSGCAVALIGTNGAGKSTLLRCIVRLTEPSSGRIDVLGKDITKASGRELARLRSRVGV